MTNKRAGCLGLILIIALCGSLFLNAIFVAILGGKAASGGPLASLEKPRFHEELLEKGSSSGGKIVQIDLSGLIASSEPGVLTHSMVEDIKLALEQAVGDPDVRAIVLSVDSPGGEVTASDVLYNALVKARESKPVVVHIGSIGASGAYYIACGASHVIATETSFTGSIGVIIHTLNYRELLGKVGLESIVFKSGKFKDMLNGAREMTPEEQAYIQNLVMQSYSKFVGIVAKERELDEQSLREGVADGRIVSGKDALKEKLIDEIGYLEDAYQKARTLSGAPEAAVVRYAAPMGLGRLIRLLGESRQPSLQILPPEVMKLQSGRMYLLPSHLAP
jgi:protease-4